MPILPDDPWAAHAGGIRRLRDYFAFYSEATTTYAQTLCTWMRERGIDTPFIHNSANPGMNAYFAGMTRALGSEFLPELGPLLQPESELAPEQPHPAVCAERLLVE